MKTAIRKEPQYITDKSGRKLSVVIPVKEYRKMMEDLEELHDIRTYDAVKARKEKLIPFSQYLERRRKHA